MADESAKPTTELERRREQFVLAYAVTGNATAAAVAAGYSPRSAKEQGVRMMADATVGTRAREARDLHLADQQAAFDRQTASIRSAADQAILTLDSILKSAKSEMAKVQAAVAVLDRAGHKPVERVESKTEHTFPTSDAVADEVDSRLDRLFAPRGTGASASGDSGPTH